MLLFTYGTLRLYDYNYHYLEKYSKHLEMCKTKDKYIMISQQYQYFPFLITPEMWPEMAQHAVQITGDLYEVTEEGMARCDQMEGHPDWYCRTPILVETSQGVKEVYAYLLTKEALEIERVGATVLSGGDWMLREQE